MWPPTVVGAAAAALGQQPPPPDAGQEGGGAEGLNWSSSGAPLPRPQARPAVSGESIGASSEDPWLIGSALK